MKRIFFRIVALNIVALSFVFAASGVHAQNKFDGAWTAGLVFNGMRCSVSLTMGPGQKYFETIRCGTMMTSQSGTYVVGQNGMVIRNVIDWQPRQRWVQDGGYRGHYEPNAKPPGGSYYVNFISANTMVWKDVNFGGVITYRKR